MNLEILCDKCDNIASIYCNNLKCKSCCIDKKCNKHYIKINKKCLECNNIGSKKCINKLCLTCCVNKDNKCLKHYEQKIIINNTYDNKKLNKIKILLYQIKKLPVDIINTIVDKYLDNRISCNNCNKYKIQNNIFYCNHCNFQICINCLEDTDYIIEKINYDCYKCNFILNLLYKNNI
jgi:hypothetical protein